MLSEFALQIQSKQKGVLIERKAFLSSKNIELHFYETIAKAYDVKMKFDSPVIAIMLKGEKHLEMEGSTLGKFHYLPGESLIVPAGKSISIDFPSASKSNPTQCLAFIPDMSLISQALYEYQAATEENDHPIDLGPDDLKEELFMRDKAIIHTVNYLLTLFQENNEHRDLFINMKTRELVIRLLQSKAKRAFLENFHFRPGTRLGHIGAFIRKNLQKPLSVQMLSREAGMSKSGFYKLFKATFGMSPNEYIIQERIKLAKYKLSMEPNKSISEISYELGYSDSSYFGKQFKLVTGMAPKDYLRNVS